MLKIFDIREPRMMFANTREFSVWLREAFVSAITGTIDTVQVTDAAITAAKIGPLAVTTAKIDALAVTTAKVALLAIGTPQLGQDITTAGKALLDDADASAQRTTLGLGTAAVENIGTSGANVPKLSTANTWTLGQTFSAPPIAPSYTVAGLPSASPAGQMAYVSNEAGGAVLAFSDATNWRRATDRAICS